MNFICIGGVPATGKTKLMYKVVKYLRYNMVEGGGMKLGTIRAEQFAKPEYQFFVLGEYDGQIFAGTDRLSMDAQKHMPDFLAYIFQLRSKVVVLFEGDRLFNTKMITLLNDVVGAENVAKVCLAVSEDTLRKRHNKRGDSQSGSWLKGRATKIQNTVNAFPDMMTWTNETEDDLERNFMEVLGFMHIDENQAQSPTPDYITRFLQGTQGTKVLPPMSDEFKEFKLNNLKE